MVVWWDLINQNYDLNGISIYIYNVGKTIKHPCGSRNLTFLLWFWAFLIIVRLACMGNNHSNDSTLINYMVTLGKSTRNCTFHVLHFGFPRIWLVVWNIFYFPIYWEVHHPNWRTHIFQRGGPTTNLMNSWGDWHSLLDGHYKKASRYTVDVVFSHLQIDKHT